MGCKFSTKELIPTRPQPDQPILTGDIGGTNLRLGLISQGKLLHVKIFLTADHPTLITAINQFISTYKIEDYGSICLAIAGPIMGRICQMTNENTSEDYDAHTLESLLLKPTFFINDFQAIGYWLRGNNLATNEFLIPPKTPCQGPILYLGSGTGLGVGFLIKNEIYPTEAGHIRFQAVSELQFQLVEFLKKELGTNHVSFERLLSGSGLGNIYDFCAGLKLAEFDDFSVPEGAEYPFPTSLKHSEKALKLSQLAHSGDAVAVFIFQIFYYFLAQFVNEMVLLFQPEKVIICSGIVAKNADLIDSEILKIFEQNLHGRGLILIKEEVSLYGCAKFVESLL